MMPPTSLISLSKLNRNRLKQTTPRPCAGRCHKPRPLSDWTFSSRCTGTCTAGRKRPLRQPSGFVGLIRKICQPLKPFQCDAPTLRRVAFVLAVRYCIPPADARRRYCAVVIFVRGRGGLRRRCMRILMKNHENIRFYDRKVRKRLPGGRE